MFAKATIVYLTGVIGMEMVGGVIASTFQEQSFPYIVCTHVEEFLEMAGLSLFIQALCRYLMRYVSSLKLYLGDITIADLGPQSTTIPTTQHIAHPEIFLGSPLSQRDIKSP
jgi:hypothetical protein